MSGIQVFGVFGCLAPGGAAVWNIAGDQRAFGLDGRAYGLAGHALELKGMDPRAPKAPAGVAPDLCRSAGERSP